MTKLHRALQQLYAGADGQLEAHHHGYRIDVLRDGVAYEIQTNRFHRVRKKLDALLDHGPVVVVYPVAAEKTLLRIEPSTGEVLGRRRSPKHGRLCDAFRELPSLATLIGRDGFSLEVVLTVEIETRGDDGHGSWRRRGVSVLDRELLSVTARARVASAGDLAALLEAPLGETFTVRELAAGQGVTIGLARKIAYTLHRSGAAELEGRSGRQPRYRVISLRADAEVRGEGE